MNAKPNIMAAAVAGAIAVGPVQKTHPALRRLTVTLTVELETADDSPLSGVVVDALREFMDSPQAMGDAGGKFESKAGADVSWRTMNRYYEHGVLIGVLGTDESGRKLDTISRLVKS